MPFPQFLYSFEEHVPDNIHAISIVSIWEGYFTRFKYDMLHNSLFHATVALYLKLGKEHIYV